IERYPEFMHGCREARVLSRSDTEVLGELTLGKAGIHHSFTTHNTLVPGREMHMKLVEGPFRKFAASWSFQPLAEDACKVTLKMEFEFAGGLVGYALEKLFNHSANTLVDALVGRANRIYATPVE